jgi:hypothetical protein
VTVEDGRATVSAIPTARTRLIDEDCDLHGVTHENAAFACLEATLAPYGPSDYVRLRLSGDVAPGTRLDTALMEEKFGATLGSLAIEDRTVSHDYESIAREPTVRGHVVRDLLDRGPGGEAALRYALAAFDGAEIAP